ncbi:MAG TPA: hypothetical protein VKS44_01175 [Candidatus Acidoferrales bacterium]|nr:hypothetical protein [Candidatus Acidoferrales bacterium]
MKQLTQEIEQGGPDDLVLLIGQSRPDQLLQSLTNDSSPREQLSGGLWSQLVQLLVTIRCYFPLACLKKH